MTKFRLLALSIAIILFILAISDVSTAQKVIAVASGYNHVLALNDDGTVQAWGANGNGQVGTGSTSEYEDKPHTVSIQGVKAVSAGVDYSLALKTDGTVWAWGGNEKGKLGDGTTQDQYTPVQVKGLSDIIAVSAGSNTNLALKSDGTVWAWGDWTFCYGKDLYAGVTLQEPVQVEGIGDVKSLGERGVFAIKSDGTVWAWGINVVSMWSNGNIYYGWLANRSDNIYIPDPFRVESMEDAREITLAAVSGAYLKNDGTVWAWGNSHNGQLGNGTFTGDGASTEVILPPVQVKISDVKQISSQGYHLLALKNDGTVWAWGKYVDGRISSNPGVAVPEKVNSLNHIVGITTGTFYNIALQDDGTVWGWGTKYGTSPVKIIQGPPASASPSPTATPTVTPTPTPSDVSRVNVSASPTTTASPAASQAGGFGSGMAMISLGLAFVCCIAFVGLNRLKR